MYSTFLKYGVPSDIAQKIESQDISVETFRHTSKKNLIEKYNLDEGEVSYVKKCIKRQPIDDDTLQCLLERNNYTCCCCHGVKGKSYIIHHIEEYSVSQDNKYQNLAVLCPTCHDLAHRGVGLTLSLTAQNILKSKHKWEEMVRKQDVEAASRNGEIHELDFINIPRVIELALQLLGKLPKNNLYYQLLNENLINKGGELNTDYIRNNHSGQYFFDFFSIRIKEYYFNIFKELLPRIEFKNLDDILNAKSINSGDFIGTFCFYVGGLYGKRPSFPLTKDSPLIRLYFKRRDYYVEWLIDPTFITTMSAIIRLSERNVSLTYGRIRSFDKKTINGKHYICVNIRPYVIGMPIKSINRTPVVRWIKNNEVEECEDNEA